MTIADRANLVQHVCICEGGDNRCSECCTGGSCGRFYFNSTASNSMLDAEMAGCLSVLVFHWRHLQWLRLLAADLKAIGDHMELSIQNLVSRA